MNNEKQPVARFNRYRVTFTCCAQITITIEIDADTFEDAHSSALSELMRPQSVMSVTVTLL
jgi:hypothetical protein